MIQIKKKINSTKKLYRNTNKKVLGGVCSGLADYFGISELLLRILSLILSIFYCIGIIIYVGLWIGIPIKKNIESDLDKSDINSIRDKSNSTTSVVKNASSLIGFIIIGCFLGLWCGWVFGQTLDSKGSIITVMIALSSSAIGSVLGSIVGVLVVSKNN